MYSCELYLLTPTILNPLLFKPLLIEALEAGPIAAVQLRLEGISDDEIRKTIDILQPVVQDRNVAFILNNHPDIAKECGCDGAHIDINNISVEMARSQLGNELQLGVSCNNSRDMAMKAGEKGADYITFDYLSPSDSSQNINCESSVDLFHWWSEMMELPVVANGSITPENCKPLIKAGVDFLSISETVWNHAKSPSQGVKDMFKAIKEIERGK